MLNNSLQWSCAKLRIKSLIAQLFDSFVSNVEHETTLVKSLPEQAQLNFNNATELFTRKLMEDEGLVDTINELWARRMFQYFKHAFANFGITLSRDVCGCTLVEKVL